MVGSALGGLGGLIAESKGWPYAFNLFGIIGTAYAVLLYSTLRDVPQAESEGGRPAAQQPKAGLWEAFTSLLTRFDFIILLVFWSLLGFANWGVVAWMPTYMNEHFHLGQGKGGITATGYFYIPAFFGVLFGGLWADRWSRTTERARIWVPFLGLCVAAPAIFFTAHTNLLLVAIVGLVTYGFTRSFSDSNMMPILCLVADSRYRATGYGLLNMFSCITGGVMIWAGGWIKDRGIDLNTVFLVASGTVLFCALLLLAVRPRSMTGVPDPALVPRAESPTD